MTLETLYKRTKTGAIQSWTISVQQKEGGAIYDIEKRVGQVNGKITTHIESISVGKNIGRSNETTPQEQAESQATADWTKKHDDGYKSLTSLGAFVPFTDEVGLYQFLETILPQFNSDANTQMKPMLAPSKPWKEGKTKYPQLIEIKFDGNRTTAQFDGTTLKLLSRSGKEHTTLNHIHDAILNSLFHKVNDGKPYVLDGEIYLHGLLLEEINEAVKKTNDNTQKLEFWLYDIPSLQFNQVMRKAAIEQIVSYGISSFIKFSQHKVVNNDKEVIEAHNAYVEDGYEGAVLKDPKGTYQPGQRSSYWQKVKMFDDSEFKIVGHKLGLRGAQDLMFICEADNKEIFDVTMNGTVESKEKILAEIDSTVGKMLTVKYFGLSKYGIPNIAKGKCIRND